MNSHGALRSMRYQPIAMFAHMSDIIVDPVIKSTMGYFNSVMVRLLHCRPSRSMMMSLV